MPFKARETPRGPYWSPWCEYTLACMQRIEVSQGDVARHLQIPVASVQAYLQGKVRPPLRMLYQWGRCMKLSREESVQFMRLAFFAHTEPEVVKWLMDAEKMAKELRERLSLAELANRKLALELAEVRAQASGDV